MTPPVILNCGSSPHTQLKPVPVNAVRFTRGFWASWFEIIKHITLPTQFKLLDDTGRLDNFRRIIRDNKSPFKGYLFNDSDVYKWLEAASWLLHANVPEELQHQIDEVIHLIKITQDVDGYLNTYFSKDNSSERWINLRDNHELYCAGHLIQAAIAHFGSTGVDDLLQPAVALADHICRRFLKTGVVGTPGHPEVEMALVELYRTTGKIKYLDMASSFLDQRGYGVIGGNKYHLDHKPFRDLTQLEGHAVRALYLCCGATDIYLETGEEPLLELLENLWERMVSTQLYITGGVGSRHQGEAIGDEFELPNAQSYAETCAAIASFMWNWRMLHSTGDVKYADLMEWTLFNAMLPGIGLGGDTYHYDNPLEVKDTHARQAWFECACCPTNIVRLLASIAGYFYSHLGNNIWIHQYSSNIVEFTLDNGVRVKFSLQTDYPWQGAVEIDVISIKNHVESDFKGQSLSSGSVGFHLRIPWWLSEKIPVYVNDKLWHNNADPGSYLKIERRWQSGDKIKLDFPMPVRYLESHPYIYENSSRYAVSRGPLLYCVEAHDNPEIDPREIFLTNANSIESRPFLDLPIIVYGLLLNVDYFKIDNRWVDRLYREATSKASFSYKYSSSMITLPYFAWGNRNKGWMRVWLSRNPVI